MNLMNIIQSGDFKFFPYEGENGFQFEYEKDKLYVEVSFEKNAYSLFIEFPNGSSEMYTASTPDRFIVLLNETEIEE